jgi:hypothetical protein
MVARAFFFSAFAFEFLDLHGYGMFQTPSKPPNIKHDESFTHLLSLFP